MKSGDILLMHDGEMVQVIELDFPTVGMGRFQSMYDKECKFYNLKSMSDMYENLGSSGSTRALFHATHSIHVRLNNLGKV